MRGWGGERGREIWTERGDHFKLCIPCFVGLPQKYGGERAAADNVGVGAPFPPLSMLYENPGDLPFNRVHHFLIPREDLHTTNRDLDRPIGSDWAGARWIHCEA